MRLSVIIPTLNEASELPATLEHARGVPEVEEIIVTDGGSTDGTREVATGGNVRWLSKAKGRGAQLRAGAEMASGDVVVLVHADVWLPRESGEAIRQVFAASNRAAPPGPVVGGGFKKQFRDGPWLLRSTAIWRSAAYLRRTGRLFGDQAIFLKRDILETMGGVPDLPLMEEFVLCRKAQQHGRLALARATVTTSSRSFAKRGVWRTWWLMWRIQRDWARGVPEGELLKRYR